MVAKPLRGKIKLFGGIRNAITNDIEWKYLLFYELDHPTKKQKRKMKRLLDKMPTSYVMYKTLNGIHIVGFTPLDIMRWTKCFATLQKKFRNYYIGSTIRLTLKEGEKQKLIGYSVKYPVAFNVYGPFYRRFKLPSTKIHSMVSNYRFAEEDWYRSKAN